MPTPTVANNCTQQSDRQIALIVCTSLKRERVRERAREEVWPGDESKSPK